MPEAALVRRVFSSIAGRYDLANRVISCGTDPHWRAQVVRMAAKRQPKVVVDLATGSGDLAFALRKKLPRDCRVTGLDFCDPMLDQARAKQKERPWASDIKFVQGDILNLDLPDESVDVLTIAWGLRNLEDRHRGLQEMLRVLRPGGCLYCLEFSQPYRWIRGPYYLYMNHMVPTMARVLTGDKGAYEYLAGTVAAFPGRHELAAQMEAAGFKPVRPLPRFFSVVAIHEALKPAHT